MPSLNIMLTILLTLCGCQVFAMTLVFRPQVEVHESKMYLNDIADIEDAGEKKPTLASIELGNAPIVGRTETLTREQVVRWVRTRHPDITEISVSGAREIIIRSASKVIASQELLHHALTSIESLVSSKSPWKPVLKSHLADVVILDKPYRLITSVIQTTSACERLLVKVDIVFEKAVYASVPIWFERGLISGQSAINGNNETIAPKNSNIKDEWCGQSWELAGDSLLPISKRNGFDIEKMKEVVVEMRSSTFMIETKGIALSNASVGQKVNIKRTGSMGSFEAVVISRGRVVVNGEGI